MLAHDSWAKPVDMVLMLSTLKVNDVAALGKEEAFFSRVRDKGQSLPVILNMVNLLLDSVNRA